MQHSCHKITSTLFAMIHHLPFVHGFKERQCKGILEWDHLISWRPNIFQLFQKGTKYLKGNRVTCSWDWVAMACLTGKTLVISVSMNILHINPSWLTTICFALENQTMPFLPKLICTYGGTNLTANQFWWSCKAMFRNWSESHVSHARCGQHKQKH